MKLSQTGMGTTKLNNIDEMYPGQSILLQTGQLVQYGAGIFGYNNVPLLVRRNIEKIIQEMINLKNEIEKELAAGNEYNLSVEEKAFFDALGNDPQVKELMKDETLVKIAKELVDTINSNMTIDWDIRKDARARMRYEIKKLLIKYDYPPVKRDSAVQLVIRQAELQCKGMIEES